MFGTLDFSTTQDPGVLSSSPSQSALSVFLPSTQKSLDEALSSPYIPLNSLNQLPDTLSASDKAQINEFLQLEGANWSKKIVPRLQAELEATLKAERLSALHGQWYWDKRFKCLQWACKLNSLMSSPFISTSAGRTLQITLNLKDTRIEPDIYDAAHRVSALFETALQVDEQAFETLEAHYAQTLAESPSWTLEPDVKLLKFSHDDTRQALNKALNEALSALKVLKNQTRIPEDLQNQALYIIQTARAQFSQILSQHYPGLEANALLRAEPSYTAQISRPIQVFASPVPREPAQNLPHLWRINWQTPQNDIPSPLRDGRNSQVPNFYQARLSLWRINDRDVSIVQQHQYQRSASLVAIHVPDPLERRLLSQALSDALIKKQVLNRLRLFLQDKTTLDARDKTELDNLMQPRISFITLLSPVVPPSGTPETGHLTFWARLKYRALRWVFDRATPGAINEHQQLSEMIECLKTRELRFSDAELQSLLTALPADFKHQALLLKHLNKAVKPDILVQNFGVNDARNLDQTGLEDGLNNQALLKISQAVLERLMSPTAGALAPGSDNAEPVDPELAALYQTQKARLMDHIENLKPNARDAGRLQGMLIGLASADVPDSRSALEEGLRLSSYLRLLFDLHTTQAGRQSPNNNYLRPVLAHLINSRLGYSCHTTCKSGEDRTGTFDVILQSTLLALERSPIAELASLDLSYSGPTAFRAKIWGDFRHSHIHSPSHLITHYNSLGARGLQSLDGSGQSRWLRRGLKSSWRSLLPNAAGLNVASSLKSLMTDFTLFNRQAKMARSAHNKPALSFSQWFRQRKSWWLTSRASVPAAAEPKAEPQMTLEEPKRLIEPRPKPQVPQLDLHRGATQIYIDKPRNFQAWTQKMLTSLRQNKRSAHTHYAYDAARGLLRINQEPSLKVSPQRARVQIALLKPTSQIEAKRLAMAEALIQSHDQKPLVDKGREADILALQRLLRDLGSSIQLQLSEKVHKNYPNLQAALALSSLEAPKPKFEP